MVFGSTEDIIEKDTHREKNMLLDSSQIERLDGNQK